MTVEQFMDAAELTAMANYLIVDMDIPLTKAEMFVFNWQYKAAKGHFMSALTDTIIRADFTNLARLYKAYPEYVTGYVAFGHNEGWWPQVQEKLALAGLI